MDKSSTPTSQASGLNSQHANRRRPNRLAAAQAELTNTRNANKALQQSVDALKADNERLRALNEDKSTPNKTKEQESKF